MASPSSACPAELGVGVVSECVWAPDQREGPEGGVDAYVEIGRACAEGQDSLHFVFAPPQIMRDGKKADFFLTFPLLSGA